jgi:hypothetical protein
VIGVRRRNNYSLLAAPTASAATAAAGLVAVQCMAVPRHASGYNTYFVREVSLDLACICNGLSVGQSLPLLQHCCCCNSCCHALCHHCCCSVLSQRTCAVSGCVAAAAGMLCVSCQPKSVAAVAVAVVLLLLYVCTYVAG